MRQEFVHTEHFVHLKWWTWQTNFDEVLDDFVMKARTKPF